MRAILIILLSCIIYVKGFGNVAVQDNVPRDSVHIKEYKTDSCFTITGIRGLNSTYENSDHSFSFDDILILKFKENIDSLSNWSKDNKLMLWFNDIAYPNLIVWRINISKKELAFKLTYDSGKNSSWNNLYLVRYRGWGKYCDTMNVQLGTDKQCLTSLNDKTKIYFNYREWYMPWAAYIIIILLLVLFVWLIGWKYLLRDTVSFADDTTVDNLSKDAARKVNQVKNRDIPFSLSRFQLCLWIFIIASSFVFIWFSTGGDMPNITSSTVLLLGISGGTSFISTIIESSRNSSNTRLTATQFYNGKQSQSFFTDILSDEKGLSISRLQMVIFTFILGSYFLWYVVIYLQMPEFNSTTTLLMGISSSTYAGIKFNEKTST